MAGGRPAARREDVLRAIAHFEQTHQRLPRTYEMGRRQQMPARTLIYTLFGNMEGLYAAYATWKQASVQGMVQCPRCGTSWHSPDKRMRHICDACTRMPVHDGAWMAGVSVPEDYWDLADFDPWEGR